MTHYAPAEAAQETGLSLDTLRYYEAEGLIGPVARTAGGRRSYSDADVAWIGTVTCMRDAGLGIDDLRRFTAMLRSGAEPEDRVAFLQGRRAELVQRAEAITTALTVLDDKIAYFSRPPSD